MALVFHSTRIYASLQPWVKQKIHDVTMQIRELVNRPHSGTEPANWVNAARDVPTTTYGLEFIRFCNSMYIYTSWCYDCIWTRLKFYFLKHSLLNWHPLTVEHAADVFMLIQTRRRSAVGAYSTENVLVTSRSQLEPRAQHSIQTSVQYFLNKKPIIILDDLFVIKLL